METTEIKSAIRSVTQIAGYFEELKQSARELADCLSASERGYFTPDEEDDVRALLVSYWQARNALLEMITSFRTGTELTHADRPAAFLTAFAAAVVLVDAARFLRETVCMTGRWCVRS